LPLPPLDEDLPIKIIRKELPSGNALLIGPSGTGKTCTLVNMLTRDKFQINKIYKWIFVFSNTIDTDASWDVVREYNFVNHDPSNNSHNKKSKLAHIELIQGLQLEMIDEILHNQDAKERADRKRVLIILDDVADQLKNSTILDTLFFRGRHSKVNCFIATQSIKRVPRSIRINSPYFFIFKCSYNEFKVIAEEISLDDPKKFIALLTRATSPKYQFLTINMKEDIDKRYTIGFTPIEL